MQEQKITTPDLEITVNNGQIKIVFGNELTGSVYQFTLAAFEEAIREGWFAKDLTDQGFFTWTSQMQGLLAKPTSTGHYGENIEVMYVDDKTG